VLGAWSLMRDQRGAVGGPAGASAEGVPADRVGGRGQALTGRMPGEALKPHALLRVAPHA
jgi:hypothetical protein